MIIGVMGPEGSYSERAAKLWALKNSLMDAEFRYFADIEDAFLAAVEGKADISVVPVENSIEGSVGVTLDLLLENEAVIIGEIVVKIEHCLLSKGGPEKIRVILSHPQGLAQCRHFLKKHFPEAELRSTGSTSHAARLAGEFEEMAAIASPEAAERYGLKILLSNIQDRKENHTRFIVIRAEKKISLNQTLGAAGVDAGVEEELIPEPCRNAEHELHAEHENGREKVSLSTCKTSLIVYLEKDRPGALYELLGAFAKRGINLTKIESRPSKKELGDYYFYIDFEGHTSDALIKDAFEDIKSKAGTKSKTKTNTLKVLGSYPAFKISK
ncbi:chorismate mutase [Methanosarcina sp. 2.H.T.1A.6]|uniref:prephenate dehydratase n=1 Tax=unclassified Methanosarcina TaxID=2644672 RepID=UPI000620FC89|nr:MULTISPECIES: prephenate dehydratase [unclassified Methanosarcina]KKG17574.1 chorismate mutase [Methanosarcina sp. 2.H.T.1A.3]KKG20458.1 chorismate mutase [Methanosarcina sp. 2.H.T.1A.6]KKG27348.1 chorismate mutase [Methanosarcina sp. 2.H.T.1A.8]KKG27554.1 chorismate mutase [Methanosarcina sp. 2.H.T.1A.15]